MACNCGGEVLPKGVESVRNGLEFLRKGVEFVGKGLEFLPKGVEFVEKGVEFLPKGVESVGKGLDLTRARVRPRGPELRQARGERRRPELRIGERRATTRPQLRPASRERRGPGLRQAGGEPRRPASSCASALARFAWLLNARLPENFMEGSERRCYAALSGDFGDVSACESAAIAGASHSPGSVIRPGSARSASLPIRGGVGFDRAADQ